MAASPHPFLDALARGAVLADGSAGTLLRARGHMGRAFEAVLDRPELVQQAHEDYIGTGAQLILATSFDANRSHMARRGRGEQVYAANLEAVRLACAARERGGVPVWIAGDVGPIGRDVLTGAMSLDEAYEAFREQVAALVEGGVDLIVLETFPSLREADAALRAARDVTDMPLVAMMNFTAGLVTPGGEAPGDVARVLVDGGADVVGVNCGVGPQVALDVLEQMAAAMLDVVLAAKPNAGLPRIVGGREEYPATADDFAEFAMRARDLGVRLIGGCCGTTPEYIAAMAEGLGRAEGATREAAER